MNAYQRTAFDLYYGDESGVALEPNVPYGWQFTDEAVSMPSERGRGINCFGLFTRRHESWVATSETPSNARFVVEQVERLSLALQKLTVVVLDNARIHTGWQVTGESSIGSTAGCSSFTCRPTHHT